MKCVLRYNELFAPWSVCHSSIATHMNNPLAPVIEIMQRNGVTGSASDFHAAVNVCFHRFESEVYDELHQDMWQSLPQQGKLLVDDCLRDGLPDQIRMLDIGSGTGLA